MELGDPLEPLFERLNRTLHKTLDPRTFICFTMAELNPASRALRLSNCGCPYPYHYKAADNEVVELRMDAYPLGIRPSENIRVLLEGGEDPYAAMVARGRELGIDVWPSIRMNDQHFWTIQDLETMQKSTSHEMTERLAAH
jgi:hypothetical protein